MSYVDMVGTLDICTRVVLAESERTLRLTTIRKVHRSNCEDIVEIFLSENPQFDRCMVWAHWSCADPVHINRGRRDNT